MKLGSVNSLNGSGRTGIVMVRCRGALESSLKAAPICMYIGQTIYSCKVLLAY